MNTRAFAVLCLAVAAAFAAPDEVKLKSGKEYKNLKKEGETATEYKFRDHEGKALVVPKANVESYVEKPTLRDELATKRALLAKPKAEDLVRIAKWADEQEGLLAKEAKELYREALGLDGENADARAALGYEMKDGKWWSAEEAAAERAKAYEERAKLAGAKAVKGKFFLPADLQKQELGLVEHEGHWVTAERKKQIVEGKLEFAEGEWLTAEEKERFDQGLRRAGKTDWKPAADLDASHSKWPSAWSVKGRWVEIRTNAKHERARFALQFADGTIAQIVKWAGVEPAVYGKEGLLLVIYGAKLDDYKQAGAGAGNDWSSVRSSSDGCFYAPKNPFDKLRGAGVTYDCTVKTAASSDEYEYARYWVRRAAYEAFVGRFTDPTKVDQQLLDAYGAYFAGFNFKRDKYAPHWFPYGMYMHNIPNKNATETLKAIRRDPKAQDPTIWQAGLFIHYLTTKNETAVKNHFLKFLGGKATGEQLLKEVFGDQKPDQINQEYEAFMKDYRARFKQTEL
jgi:hypothetical protein